MENLQKSIERNHIIIIPARGGSVRVRDKNTRLLCGRPLIQWTIQQAVASGITSNVYVSTDSPVIADISEQSGARVIRRPAAISDSEAASEEALIHALDTVERTEDLTPETVVMLQCTSPLRRARDIQAAVTLYHDTAAGSVVSVVEKRDFIWTGPPDDPQTVTYDPQRRPRSQDLPPVYKENGSIYVTSKTRLISSGNRLNTPVRLYVMPAFAEMDIDTEYDFQLCEVLMSRYEKELEIP